MDANGDFVIAWVSSSLVGTPQDGDAAGIFGQRYNAAGVAQGAEFQVNTYTTGYQGAYVSVATDPGGNFVVVWPSRGQDGSGYGVFGQRFASLLLAALKLATDQNEAPARSGEDSGFSCCFRNSMMRGEQPTVFSLKSRRSLPARLPVGGEYGAMLSTAERGRGAPLGIFCLAGNPHLHRARVRFQALGAR
jgi:hypothetical protein